jgi:hypothetical protein
MKTFINLLPFEYRRRELVRLRLLQWSLVWAGCLLLIVAAWWLKQGQHRASRQAVEAAETRFRPLKQLMGQRRVMENELRKLHAKGTVLGQLRDERPLFTLIGMVSESARECRGRLVVDEMSFQHNTNATSTDRPQRDSGKPTDNQPAADGSGPRASVTLRGTALDNLAVARFAAALRDSGLFGRVELKSSVGDHSAAGNLRAYLLECDIE